MPDLYPLVRPLLGLLPAEAAHSASLRALETGLGRFAAKADSPAPDPPILAQRLWGRIFANPVGLAAGYDKDARVPDAMLGFGFGFVEIGTVTPRPQPGNPKPRVFRLAEDRALINRLGFNSGGLDAVTARLARRPRNGIVGLNIGRNRDSTDAEGDYEEAIRRGAGLADYLAVNISSPNTPGLRELQRRAALEALLQRLLRARDESQAEVPLVLKIAPDLSRQERRDIAEIALSAGIDGLIVANTTVERPAGLKSKARQETGGLSGQPLFGPSTALLAEMYRLTRGRLPLIGTGGVGDAAQAYAKIRAGASLVQLYTALVFEGPALVGRIKEGIAKALGADGFHSLGEAVGTLGAAEPAVRGTA
jgi:dihydroorotate dehydrogenase